MNCNKADIIADIQNLLDNIVAFIESTIWRNKYIHALKNLQEELNAPCVLAIAGKVKSGKSFLVNALLGVDLAMTGNTETTATINIFKKGKPLSKDKPILCFYTNGEKEWITKDMLNSLQGTSEQTLAKTANIDKLIMYIDDNPLLDYVTLVDTPGIGADVGEDGDSHQIHTDSYFKLRERHQKETIDLSNTADAIIYMFNTVPTQIDKEFLTSLYDNGHGITALNGIGVLSKIDKDLSQINNITNYCKSFEHNLFSIVPVSAAVEKYIPSYDKATKLRNQLRSGFETEKVLNLACSSETAFLHEKLPYCKMTVEERKSILKEFAEYDLAWSAFALIAKELYYADKVDDALEKLNNIGGIRNLKDVIFNHFFYRSHLLRGNKILGELRKIINDIMYDDSYIYMEERSKMKDECIKECMRLPEKHKRLLIELIQTHIPSLEKCINDQRHILDFKYQIEKMQTNLSIINNKFLLYRKIVDAKKMFNQEEFNELTSLFSGQPINLLPINRYKYWAAVANSSMPNSVRNEAAILAKKLYAESLS